MVPYVDAVTVMRVLLYVLHVCVLREIQRVRMAGLPKKNVKSGPH